MPEFKMLTYIHFKGEMAPRVLANLVSIHPNPCGIMRASNAKIDVLLVKIRRVRVGKAKGISDLKACLDYCEDPGRNCEKMFSCTKQNRFID